MPMGSLFPPSNGLSKEMALPYTALSKGVIFSHLLSTSKMKGFLNAHQNDGGGRL